MSELTDAVRDRLLKSHPLYFCVDAKDDLTFAEIKWDEEFLNRVIFTTIKDTISRKKS